MPLRVAQFRYGRTNLAYLLCGEREAAAVDGGAVPEILQTLEEEGLELTLVLNTHSHSDHTCGNERLLEATSSRHMSSTDLIRKGSIELDGQAVSIMHTPGHTADSVCLKTGDFLLTGDTLFAGKVGRCFSGDVEGFYRSISRIDSLPSLTVVCGGHDYVEEYMEFAAMVEPHNPHIEDYLKRYDPRRVMATLGREREVDPFLRLEEPSVIEFLKRKRLPARRRIDRFHSLLGLM
jgi:hydroxyacylglutathione hydrolase